MLTVSEIMALAKEGKNAKTRCRSGYAEHHLQASELSYMKAKHFDLRHIFFAVPNGQKRTSRQTAWLKEEGLVNGVADMILLKPNKFYGYLCIENKTPKGRQSEEQKQFQEAVEANGGKYVICRSLDDFIREIETYLQES